MPTTTRLALALALLIPAAACDLPTDDGDATGAQTTGEPDEPGSTSDSPVEPSTGDDAARGAPDQTTGGADGTGGYGGEGTGGEGGSCFGESCAEFGCAAGLVCAEDPVTGAPVCATPCGPPFVCNEVALAVCGAVEPSLAVCRTDLPQPLCFPA